MKINKNIIYLSFIALLVISCFIVKTEIYSEVKTKQASTWELKEELTSKGFHLR